MARILVAEDEDSLRSLVQRALMLDGHEVAVAPDGAEALDMLGNHEGGFELLLADIKMPIMDGIALALAAARDHPDLIILLMTGYADQRERASDLERVVIDVVDKPFTLPEIRQAVAGALAAGARRTR